MGKLLTFKQAGEILGLRPNTVRDSIVGKGKLPIIRISSSTYRIDSDELDKYIKEITVRLKTKGDK